MFINNKFLDYSMWIAKFRNWHKTCSIRPLCIKYNITDYVYLLNYWIEGKKFYYTELHLLDGEEENVREFINDFKKDNSLKRIEIIGNQVITLNYLSSNNPLVYSAAFDPKIIYTKPIIQHSDGYETWEVASWDKQTLMKIMDIPDFKMEILFVKKIDGIDIFLPQIQPKIPDKQLKVLKLAIKEGYYKFPRKTNLDKLSKNEKVSKPTFQENLRKAENKLIPFLVKGIK